MGVEGVVTNLVARSLESLAKFAYKKAKSWDEARNDLQKLEDSIRTIQARVQDAERRQEEENSEVIKVWLGKLRFVLFRADDLFDKILTLDRQNKLAEHWVVEKTGFLFPRNRKLVNEIKSIRKELDVIKFDMEGLNLRVFVGEEVKLSLDGLIKKRESASFVKKEDVIGRENDVKAIIEMIFDPKYDDKRVTVIPIVGFGGIGKTTLAQYVFNDETVEKSFDLLLWVCVPEVDNQRAIMTKIYRSMNETDFGDYSLDQIKSRIKSFIKDKTYLLVLDDIWDESRDRWLDLVRLLECGGFGSKIIVTSRSDVVAKAVGTIPRAYRLGVLTDGESWKLFQRLAFKPDQEESNPNLTQIGKKIVRSCGNVPLAIRVVGTLLYSKDSEKEWNFFKDDQLSKAKLVKDGDIMPVLKLSYDYLTPTLKQCFAYCSLFPKDYEFNKVALVHLWMSQGYFEPSHRDIGDHYFMELLWRNFFQDPEEDDEGNIKSCKMHDLMHDLAQYIAGNESKLLNECSIENSGGLIHGSFNCELSDTSNEDRGWEVPKSLLDASRMRSLLFVSKYPTNSTIKESSLKRVVLKFKYLRALELKDMKIDKIPNSIEKLRHLRYLNLEGSTVKSLPTAITRLENLQTLNLDHCEYLKELPIDFPKLANLRHLIIDWGNLTDLPSGFGNMTSLQEFHKFVVGEGRNTGIDSLPALKLRGKLELRFCIWHENAIQEAQRASLKDNRELTNLALNFRLENLEEENTPTFSQIDEMLMSLQLPKNLKHLKVDAYGGKQMPIKWFEGFDKLAIIFIEKCKNITILPQFSQLPHLKSLYIRELDALEYIEDEDALEYIEYEDALEYIEYEDALECIEDENDMFGSTNNKYFPFLVNLELINIPKLKGWRKQLEDGNEIRQLVFPNLLHMKVDGCRQLISIPLTPKLESLEAKRINWDILKSKVMPLDYESSSSSLSSLSMLCTSLKQLKLYQIREELELLSISKKLCNLEKIEIFFSDGIKGLMFESPNSIRFLNIYRCKNLRNISNGFQNLHTLEDLRIRSCDNLEEEQENEEHEESEGKINKKWRDLKSLRFLYLLELPKFKRLPPEIASLTTIERLSIANLKNLSVLLDDIGNLCRLQDLSIINCPKLKSIPPLIEKLTSLKRLQISGCSDLSKRCKDSNGEDWHLIKHIPQVEIEG